jgi:hypothetical protein
MRWEDGSSISSHPLGARVDERVRDLPIALEKLA